VKAFVEHHGLLPRGARLQAEDVAARLHFVLAARILDPQFQGQVKEKLTSRDALKLVAQVVRDPLEVWLNAHVDYGKRIAELAIQQALTRMKSAQKVEKRKGSGVAVLPGSSPTASPTTSRGGRCSWSKAIPPAVRPSLRATSSTRPSCPCAARC
jgi:topoisomerase-4 subunit B